MVDFRFDPGVESFRAEVQTFLRAAMADAARHPDPSDLTGLDEEFERRLSRAAGERGWLQLPRELRAVFEYEVARVDAPLIDTAMTLGGHVVATYGSAAQREQLLGPMAAGEVLLCIAYTEEGAGSDLAAIETVAERDGDGWVLHGTKVLVTGAHKADWCCTVARTRPDVPARHGMSMFLLEMSTPGVVVVRRTPMNGWTLGDVHFRDVRVDAGALLGDVDNGWRQLMSSVASERSHMSWMGFARHVLDLIVDHVQRTARDDPVARDTVGRLAVEFAAADRLARRTLWSLGRGEDDPALTSMFKVVATELLQDLAQAATELAGPAGLTWAPLFGEAPVGSAAAGGGRFAYEYLERVHGTVSVGANEVQLDAIAQRGLGLPRPAQ